MGRAHCETETKGWELQRGLGFALFPWETRSGVTANIRAPLPGERTELVPPALANTSSSPCCKGPSQGCVISSSSPLFRAVVLSRSRIFPQGRASHSFALSANLKMWISARFCTPELSPRHLDQCEIEMQAMAVISGHSKGNSWWKWCCKAQAKRKGLAKYSLSPNKTWWYLWPKRDPNQTERTWILPEKKGLKARDSKHQRLWIFKKKVCFFESKMVVLPLF